MALVPQGGNTGMVAGATPPEDGSALILSLRRMNQVRAIDAEAGIAVAEAGVILANLHAAAAEVGPALSADARRAGAAAPSAGSSRPMPAARRCCASGRCARWSLGVEAVLADGSVHDGLSGLKKDNRGYSLDQLLVGSEGTLGIITAARLAAGAGDQRPRRRLARPGQPRAMRSTCCASWSAAPAMSRASRSCPPTACSWS